MRPWLYFLSSKKEYQNFIKVFEEIDDKQSFIFIVIDGVLHCTDGRSFGSDGEKSIVLFFHTHFSNPANIIKKNLSLNPASLLGLFDLDSREIDLSLYRRCILKKGLSFVFDEGLTIFPE